MIGGRNNRPDRRRPPACNWRRARSWSWPAEGPGRVPACVHWGTLMQSIAPLVLVIDDDEATSELLRFVLEAEGYRVEWASDGLSGIARITAGGVDFALLPPPSARGPARRRRPSGGPRRPVRRRV